MMLTGLESSLLAGAVCLVSCFGTKTFCEWRSVTQKDCSKCHDETRKTLTEICRKLDRQWEVNRVILTKLRIPVEAQIELEKGSERLVA